MKPRPFSSYAFCLTLVVVLLVFSGVALWSNSGGIISCGQTRIGADLDGLSAVFKDYYRIFGQFPKGDSAAILKTLTGDNEKRMAFLGTEGQILDPWKTPYHFSRNADESSVEIRSAGPDKVLWSSDDFVSKAEVPTR